MPVVILKWKGNATGRIYMFSGFKCWFCTSYQMRPDWLKTRFRESHRNRRTPAAPMMRAWSTTLYLKYISPRWVYHLTRRGFKCSDSESTIVGWSSSLDKNTSWVAWDRRVEIRTTDPFFSKIYKIILLNFKNLKRNQHVTCDVFHKYANINWKKKYLSYIK
jgi:hypothetical protein